MFFMSTSIVSLWLYETGKYGKILMFFMSTSMVLCQNLLLSNKDSSQNSFSYDNSSFPSLQPSIGRRKSRGLMPNAKKRHPKRKKTWWQRFFFDEEGNWLGLNDEETFDVLESNEVSSDDELSENEKFEAWERRAEAIVELREAQEDVKNEEIKRWEDWLVDYDVSNGEKSWFENSNGEMGKSRNDGEEEFSELFSGRGLVKLVRDLVLGREDDDILYEDRVFRYASIQSVSGLE